MIFLVALAANAVTAQTVYTPNETTIAATLNTPGSSSGSTLESQEISVLDVSL